MADAWGGSWGGSWGNSWGSTAPTPSVSTPGPGYRYIVDELPRIPKRKKRNRDKDVDIALAMLLLEEDL